MIDLDQVNNRTVLQLLINAINCEVPHKYIRQMLTGEKEAENQKITIDQKIEQRMPLINMPVVGDNAINTLYAEQKKR